MKKLLTILLFFFSLAAHSQTWTPIQFQSGVNYYDTDSAIASFPPTYADSANKRYPVVLFFPGVGEAGSLNNIKNTGLPQLITQGQVPQAINPVDGKTYEFIVIAFKNDLGMYNSGSVFNYVLTSLYSQFRIDTSRVYATGLSMGAQSSVTVGVWQPNRIAAIYPVAFTGYNGQTDIDSIKTVGNNWGVRLWTVAGSNDVTEPQNAFNKSLTLVNDYNTNSPSPLGIRTIINGADHSSATWNTAYDTAWRANSNNTTVAKNMYEWFLQYKRTFVSGNGTTPNPPTNAVVDDVLNTFNWTNNPSFTTADKYEFTEDSGYTYMRVREKPIHVGNVGLRKGYFGVRIKSISGDPPSATLYSNAAYTQVVPPITPSNITVTVTLTGTPVWTTKLNPALLKYNKWGRFGMTNDDRRTDGVDVAAYITGNGIVSPQKGLTYAGKRFTDGANVRGRNIAWTATEALNAWQNSDSTTDVGLIGGMTWTQAKSLIDNGWSFGDHGAWHGIGLQGPSQLGFNTLLNSAANRDYSYRQSLAVGAPYVLRVGIVPTNDPGYHSAWEQLGYLGGSSESTNDNYPDVVQEWYNFGLVPVNNYINDNRYKVHLRMFKELQAGYGTGDIIAQFKGLTAQASNTNRLSAEYGFHGADWDSLTKAMDTLDYYDNDKIWICGLQEFYEYFQTYQQSRIKQTLAGNVLTVTIDQSFLSDEMRWRDMSFMLSSNSSISSVTVTGADDYSYNTATGLINIYKKKTSGFTPPESALNNGFVFGGRLPLDSTDIYFDNNFNNRPSALIDGDTTTRYLATTYGGDMVFKPYDIVFDLSDYGAIVNRVQIRSDNTSGFTTKVIVVRNDNEAEDSIGVFTGTPSNQWFTFYPDTSLNKFVASKVILRSDNPSGFGTEVRIFGDYLPYTEQVYKNKGTPLRWQLGVNSHWWNFVNNGTGSATALATAKIIAFDSLHMHSLRNYGNAYAYQNADGSQFGFNPTVGGGWFEDLFMRRLKLTNPDLIRWSVLQGQTTAVANTWNIPDTSWWIKAVVSSYVIHNASWGTLNLTAFASKGSGTFTKNFIKKISGNGVNTETSNDWVSATDVNISLQIDGIGGFAAGDTLWIQGRHTSALNYNYANNNVAGRLLPNTWDSVARLTYFWSARKGTNQNATKYVPFLANNGYAENNDDSVGINTSEWTEIMNEPTASWAGFDDDLDGKSLAVAWSKAYDNNKVFASGLGSKNADTAMKVSTSGLAVSESDVMRSADSYTRRLRGNRAKEIVPVQPYSWKARTFGWADNPYDIIQFHNYSYTGGSNQYAGNTQSGLPPEIGHALVAADNFVWFRNKYAPWAPISVGEWGYDVNQNSPMNAPPIDTYNKEQVRGAWTVRTMLEYNAHGIDYSELFRLYQDSEADSSNSGQFATMSLLQSVNDDPNNIRMRLVGRYLRQFDELGDYVYDSTLREDSLRVIRYRKDTSYVYAIWAVEGSPNQSQWATQKAIFTNRTGIYNLPLTNGTAVRVRTFMDTGVSMSDATATVSGGSLPVSYGLMPQFVQVGGSGQPPPPPVGGRFLFKAKKTKIIILY